MIQHCLKHSSPRASVRCHRAGLGPRVPVLIFLICFSFQWDVAFLLTVGSFLLTVELFYLRLTILAFLLAVGAFSLTILAFLLTVGAFCLQWESAFNKALRDCKQRGLTVSTKAPTVSKKVSPFFFCKRRFGCLSAGCSLNQRFRKGVGGQRGLAQGNPSHTTDSGLCSAPFS